MSASSNALTWEEWASRDALGLAELVRNQEVSPEELAWQAAAAVQALNPRLNAVLEVFEDRLEPLDDLPADGAFRGVPFFLKDIGAALEGRLQEQGSRFFAGCRPDFTSAFTERCQEAGLNIMGRTATPELGSSSVTESRLTGVTRNPWNPDRTPGGSSGGAAAVVSSGILPMSCANDGGGSTRYPAACCGNVGLKHSRGLVSQGPELNDYLGCLFSEGVNARTLRDVAAFLDAVKGPTAGESNPYVVAEPSYLEGVKERPSGLRIGVLTDAYGVTLDAEIEAETRRVADHLSGLGHKVERFRPDFDFDGMVAAFEVMWAYLMSVAISARENQLGRSVAPGDLEPVTWKLWERSQVLPAVDVALAHASMNEVCRQLGGWFERIDAILSPVRAQPTPEVGGEYRLDREDLDFGQLVRSSFELIPFTPIANFTGRPAISLPLGRFADGMPMGMQLLADLGQDGLLIRIGAQLEESMPWRDRRAPIHVTTLADA